MKNIIYLTFLLENHNSFDHNIISISKNISHFYRFLSNNIMIGLIAF